MLGNTNKLLMLIFLKNDKTPLDWIFSPKAPYFLEYQFLTRVNNIMLKHYINLDVCLSTFLYFLS